MSKTYSSKSNAKRAAIGQGLEASGFRLVEVEGGWVIELQSDPVPAAAPEPNADATPREAPQAEAAPAKARRSKAAKADTPEADPALIAEAARIFTVTRPQPRHLDRLRMAQRGEMPAPLDFSAATHAAYRKRLQTIEAAIAAGDIAALEGHVEAINPRSSSPRALLAFAALSLVALNARA